VLGSGILFKTTCFRHIEVEHHMRRIRRFIVMGWTLFTAIAIAQEQSTDGIAPQEAQARAPEDADVAADRQLGQALIGQYCAAMANGESMASMLRQLLEDIERRQAEPYGEVSRLRELLAELERGLETLPRRSDCDANAVALLPLSGPLVQQDLGADDSLLLEELAQERDGPYPIGVPFPEEVLTCRYYRNAIVDQILSDANGDPIILLTSVVTSDFHGKRFPNIVHMADGGYWVRTPIPRTGDGWTHVHVSPDLQHVLLLMDHTQESAGWETSVVVSADRGRTWRYGDRFRKYVYFDVISYFSMSDSGFGTAVEHYVGGVGGYEDIGYYIFDTSDWGLTWSDRAYEKAFDTSGHVDVLPGRLQRISAETPLSQVSLLGFNECATP
jgi:hypothetical protein